ncbi:uncharacterized protein LOC132553562 [Ylistrum balloti]|uniref:uncharacterized protein LOC132553562 n=1 Tax=Ylistrum balloti TaxID=509963 RepID=UPI002905C3E9|nr:uncharacterized protein LOC132553562 [Ylistrum balloti]
MTMDDEAVIITPWSEYLITAKHINDCSLQPHSLPPYIAWDAILHLAPETDDLRHIIASSKNGHILRVDTERDVEELSDLLLNRPLLMRVTLVHTMVASKYSADTVSIWEGDYAVILNTRHQTIRAQLRKALNDAITFVTTRWRFCIEIDLSDIIEGWYLQTIDVYSGCDDFQTTKCRRSRIYVTNHMTYNHCFDCSPKWWLCFSPCWLLTAPCYIGYRRLTCKDIRLKLNAKVSPVRCLRRTSSTSDETKSKTSTIVNYKMEDDVATTSSLKSYFRPDESTSYGAV